MTTTTTTTVPLLKPCTCAIRYWVNWEFKNSSYKQMTGMTLEKCLQACHDDNNCKAFSFYTNGQCHLKSGTSSDKKLATISVGVTSGCIGTYIPQITPPMPEKPWNPPPMPDPTANDVVQPNPTANDTPCVGPTCGPPTADPPVTPKPGRPDCTDQSKFCYWKNIGLGWTQNFLHQCAVSSQEKCWAMCKDKAGCVAASFDTKGRWSRNCFLYSSIDKDQMSPFPDMVSGWFCSYPPPVFPSDPVDGCWLPPPFPTPPTPVTPTGLTTIPVTTESTTTTPKPAAPTCSGWGTMLCRVYSDPHFQTISGVQWDQHDIGRFKMAEYVGNDLPEFKVILQFVRRWPCNHKISMVDKFWITWQSKDGCGTYELEGLLDSPPTCGPPHGPQGRRMLNKVASRIVYIDKETQVRTPIQTHELNRDGNRYVQYHQTMTLTTWFGLNFYYDSIDWDATLKIPNCFRGRIDAKSLCLIAWKYGLSWNHRARRAIIGGPEKQEQVITESTHDVVKRSANTCPLRDHIQSRCGLMSQSDGPFQQCHAKFPTDGDFGFEANCVTDHCEDSLGNTVPDACNTLASYAKMCMGSMVGEFKKSDKICQWAKETGCEPECPAHSHWEPCADQCKDVRTCGDRSPVPKDCGDTEFASMCICDEGFFPLNGDCVPESECGCVTDEQAVVANGYTEETCKEFCECKDNKYQCNPHPDDVVPEGCSGDPVDGKYGEWTDWSSCMEEKRFRSRDCNSPAPSNGGQDCEGESLDEETCEDEDTEEVEPEEELKNITDRFKEIMVDTFGASHKS